MILHYLKDDKPAVNVLDAVLLDLKQMPNTQGLNFILDQQFGGLFEAL